MATTYLALLNGVVTGDTLPAASWNTLAGAQDRAGMVPYNLLGNGVFSGWHLTSGASTITSGAGFVGHCWCNTAAAQSISGLVAASTNYVYAKADAGSPASGTIDFVARATSAGVTNYDGATAALYLGKGTYASATGIKSITSTGKATWSIDHGGLTGLSDDDHPDYMRPIEVVLHGKDALFATSAASTSTYGTNARDTLVKFPALSATKGNWAFVCPADYSGTITLYADWVSSGTVGKSRWSYLVRNVASGEAFDGALGSACAAQVVAISGTAGHLRRTSIAWTSLKPTAGDRCTVTIRRDGANASDVCSGVARLAALRVKLNTAR
ncbi:MAG: hypothetical protein WC998_09905 [Candidatus Paceibacterota bacterium]|jgi:hypothetical protein